MNPAPLHDAYREGIRLFNEQQYWHAHEHWEQCWREAAEPDATFYKALIQTAAALVKWQQGNLRGLHLNWAKSRARLLTLPAAYYGLDLIALRRTMEHLLHDPHGHPPKLPEPDPSPSSEPRKYC